MVHLIAESLHQGVVPRSLSRVEWERNDPRWELVACGRLTVNSRNPSCQVSTSTGCVPRSPCSKFSMPSTSYPHVGLVINGMGHARCTNPLPIENAPSPSISPRAGITATAATDTAISWNSGPHSRANVCIPRQSNSVTFSVEKFLGSFSSDLLSKPQHLQEENQRRGHRCSRCCR